MVQEVARLLSWEVGDEKAAATVLGQAGAESLMAHLQHAIVVAHQEYFEIKGTGGTLHEGKKALPVHAGLQGALVGTDKHRAIGNRFTKRELQLNKIDIGALHSFEHRHVRVKRGITDHRMGHE